MRKKWKIIIGIVAVIILIGIGLGQCQKAMKKAISATAGVSQSHTVAYGDISTKIEITGEIQPQTVVSIKSRVSGKIVKFYAQENDFVKIGQIIADIEPDYNQANTLFNTKASLRMAELRLNNARKDLADKTLLLEKQYISQSEYDTAADALKSAEIEFAQASSQYEMIRDLDVPGTVTHVYATASGTVIERKVNEGEMVTSSINAFGEGTVVMKIADLSHMIVKSNINEVDITKFSLGQKAEIKLDALPYQQYEGKIVKIAPMAITENNAKVFPVEISINATGEVVKPGMTAAVNILGETREHVLVIPIAAVFMDDRSQDVVYVVPPQKEKAATKGKAAAPATPPVSTPIQMGTNDFQMVEVISGLKEGDVISLSEPPRAPTAGLRIQ